MKKIAVTNRSLIPLQWGIKIKTWDDVVALGKENLKKARTKIRAEERANKARSSTITELKRAMRKRQAPKEWREELTATTSCSPLRCRECKYSCPCSPDTLFGGEREDLTGFCCEKLTSIWGSKKFTINMDDKCHIENSSLVESVLIRAKADKELKWLGEEARQIKAREDIINRAIRVASPDMPLLPQARAKEDLPSDGWYVMIKKVDETDSCHWEAFEGFCRNQPEEPTDIPIEIGGGEDTANLKGPTDPRFLKPQEFKALKADSRLRDRWLKLITVPSGYSHEWSEAFAYERDKS